MLSSCVLLCLPNDLKISYLRNVPAFVPPANAVYGQENTNFPVMNNRMPSSRTQLWYLLIIGLALAAIALVCRIYR